MYKDSPSGCLQVVGKRILCSNRYGRTGCGHTRQLYLADVIPKRRYALSVAIVFIHALINGALAEEAYLKAVGPTVNDARHAWRWLKDFYKTLSQWRTMIVQSMEDKIVTQRSPILKIIVPTLAALLPHLNHFQLLFQHSFF